MDSNVVLCVNLASLSGQRVLGGRACILPYSQRVEFVMGNQ